MRYGENQYSFRKRVQQKPWSDCAFAQSDQGFCCTLIESLEDFHSLQMQIHFFYFEVTEVWDKKSWTVKNIKQNIPILSNTVDSRYLEFQGTHWNTSRCPYLDISELREWGKQ